ncbi:MAG: alpha/beta fold hydrolase, partial [Anaerolineales bacterium]|nr:alpha/beta fold hydrolase [Anaerolineales bacterium]
MRTSLHSKPNQPASTRPWKKPAYWLKLIAFALISLYISLTVAMAVMGTVQSIRPAKRPVCCETPADWGFTYEDASLTAPDGIRLVGWYIPPQSAAKDQPAAAVILLHGYASHRLATKSYAEMLARHGYAVLMYDQRASGESEGETLSWGWRDVADVQGAIAYLQGRPELANGKIGVLGCSTGAEIAIAAAAQQSAIQAVVADAPYYTTAQDLPPADNLLEWLSIPMYHLLIQLMEWKSGASAPQ